MGRVQTVSSSRIVVADDHPVVRRGVKDLLEAEPGFEVIGEASTGQEVIEAVERLKPDVLVLDVSMPGLSGLEVLLQVKNISPETRVLIFSIHGNDAYVAEALRKGANGYVLKDAPGEELVRAIHEARAGRHFLSHPLSEQAIAAFIQKAEEEPLDPYYTLTAREREVLQLAAEGHNGKEISSRLSISPRTAETHRANLMRKLGLHSQTDLVKYAIRQGIISEND